jgi:hypothetical protein
MERAAFLGAMESDALAEGREQPVHLGPRRAVTDDVECPRELRDPGECLGQHPIGGELVAGPHHGNCQEPSRAGHGRPGHALRGRGSVHERRQCEEPLSGSDCCFQAGAVMGRQCKQDIGPVDCRLRAGVGEGPGPVGALLRTRGLGDDVGNAEPARDLGAEVIRRLVVAVIGEPQARSRIAGQGAVSGGEPVRLAQALSPKSALPGLAAEGLPGRERTCERGRVAGGLEGAHEEPGHGAVA